MTTRSTEQRHVCAAPLSPEARAWEIEQLKRFGLEDEDWTSEGKCPFCAGQRLSVELDPKDRVPFLPPVRARRR
ncbi:hypothetical protein [Sorangium sp. So ce131]|uniref:hypothetical protein n=1 Tax=Sorangium sp. So ce131 TaxID=3133282 RepID=UPI003F6233AD